MSGHFFAIALIHLLLNGVSLIVWIGLSLVSCGVTTVAATEDLAGGAMAGGFFTVALGIWLAVGILPGLACGYWMLSRNPMGRILAIIFGVLSLPAFPIGTAFGAWTLWALLSEEGAREYRAGLR